MATRDPKDAMAMAERLELVEALAAKDAEIARLSIERDKARDAHAALCPYNAALAAERAKVRELRGALSELRINANRLCDRQLGGTYEDDCRRSLKKAEDALGLTGEEPPKCPPGHAGGTSMAPSARPSTASRLTPSERRNAGWNSNYYPALATSPICCDK